MTILDAASTVTKGATILLLHLIADAVVCALCHASYYHPPRCVDHPEGYSCECGPGFRWNTQTCVALGLNSRLEFAAAEPVRFALLQDKAFPELHSFTVALWIRVKSSDHPGTILSYSHTNQSNLLRIISGPTLRLSIQDEEIVTGYKVNASTWVHLVWTWTSDGSYKFFINDLVKKGKAPKADKVVPGGGRLVLGQAAEIPGKGYDTTFAFVGDIGGVNVWNYALSRQAIKEIASDCNLIHCGNGIEWADFRSGTRGFVKLRWPSLIGESSNCITDETSAQTCDNYCSVSIGPQCNAAMLANAQWDRTPAGDNATVRCPNRAPDSNQTAYRECVKDDEANDGRWLEPIMDACISQPELTFKRAARDLSNTDPDPSKGPKILSLIEALDNQTSLVTYGSILDIAVVSEALKLLLQQQSAIVDIFKPGKSMFGLDRNYDKRLYPSFDDSLNFAKSTSKLVDHLLADRNTAGWRAMLPSGEQGVYLLASWKFFVHLIIRSHHLHVTRADIAGSDRTVFTQSLSKLSLVVQHLQRESQLTIQLPMPNVIADDLAGDGHPTTKPVDISFEKNSTQTQDILVALSWLNYPHLVPNHNISTKVKEDNINTALLHVLIEGEAAPFDFSVTITFQYINTFNISNPECVMLQINQGLITKNWTRRRCSMVKFTSTEVTCKCRNPGVMAAVTDMYDVNWDNGERPIDLMSYPSYIGCSLSAVLCFFSLILLIYFRTQSKTAELHKHFAMAIFCCQLTFLLGIDKVHSWLMCRIFAVTFHYFFLATFQWLMNEAFNLYIVITYAAHSHGEHTEGGSQWRYYILGWVLPGVLVGASVGTHMDDYYAHDMCWISWQYVWLFFGPAICIISVTVLVLIFTAKEHHESSYSKNERTNKVIVIYAKALWTQTILLVMCWFFAFLSIKMGGIIIKCLFALFNGLQGAFFFVFYFLLNEEVQAVYKASSKKKNLSHHGFDFSPTSSMEDIPLSVANENATVQGSTSVRASLTGANQSPRPSHSKDGQQVRSRRKRTEIEVTSTDEEGSDCEMMITSV